MNYIIRKGTKEECNDVAHVISIAWNEAYKGIVPDWYLKELLENEKERAEKLYNDFDKNSINHFVLEVNNKVVGFARFGPSSDCDFSKCGEIIALYIIGKYKGNGFGKFLVEKSIEELKLFGFDKIIISCLKGNNSNSFYQHIGGIYVKDSIFKRLSLPENIYYYEI